MTDAEFLRAFEDWLLPAAALDHRGHLRVAWLYLRSAGRERGAARIAEGLRAFAVANGVPQKYEEGLTQRWIARVSAAILRNPAELEFEAFLAGSPELLSRAREPATGTSLQPCGTGASAPRAS